MLQKGNVNPRSEGAHIDHSRTGLICAVLLALASTALTFVAAPHGSWLSHDSVIYLRGAQSILTGHLPQGLDGRPLTVFPPGLSIAIAIAAKVTGSLRSAATVVELASQFLIVLLTYLVARRSFRRESWMLICTATVAFNGVVIAITSMASSEGPMVTAILAIALVIGGSRADGLTAFAL